MSDTSTDNGIDFLEHYGVLGMHWGIRKADPNLSRSRQAIIERNKNQALVVKTARSGEGYRAAAAIGRAFVGRERQQKNWNTTLTRLNQQNQRLRSGNLFIRDRIDLTLNTSLLNRYVSATAYRKPNKPGR